MSLENAQCLLKEHRHCKGTGVHADRVASCLLVPGEDNLQVKSPSGPRARLLQVPVPLFTWLPTSEGKKWPRPSASPEGSYY